MTRIAKSHVYRYVRGKDGKEEWRYKYKSVVYGVREGWTEGEAWLTAKGAGHHPRGIDPALREQPIQQMPLEN